MALLTGTANLAVDFSCQEYKTAIGTGTISGATGVSSYVHTIAHRHAATNGTGANTQSVIYSLRGSISASTDYDLSGSLASVLDGSTVSFPIVTMVIIENLSVTSGEYLSVGGDAASFPLFGATNDLIKVGPGGILVVSSPIDGWAVTNSTADVLQIAPATGTVEFNLTIVGRAS